MKTIQTVKFFYRAVSLLAFLSLLLPGAARADSAAWKERIEERTAVLWVEGQFLGDDLVLNARGELNVTWIEQGLSRIYSSDRDADEWVVDGINYYFSSRKDIKAKMKGRDVFVLTCRAVKRWSFDITKLTVNGYAVTPEDVLTRREYWQSEMPPGYVGRLEVAVPSVKPGQTVEIRYEDASAQLETPSRAR